MTIKKKVKCLRCNFAVEEVVGEIRKCPCGNVSLSGATVISEGVEGKDWVDISPRVLNEVR